MAEKTINELAPDLRRQHTKAVEAVQRDNTDYAIALFCQILEREPAVFDCRKALRAAQLKKAGATSTGFFKKMWSGAGSSPQVAKAKMILNKSPGEAMAIAEEILNADPHNSAAHRIIVDAAQVLELPRTAAMSYESLVSNSPKDRKLAIEYADSLAASGDISPAEQNRCEKILMDLLRDNPGDGDLNQALKNLSARKTMDQGGYAALEDGSGSFRDILKNKTEAVLARTGKARREVGGHHRAAHRRIRGAAAHRAAQYQARALARGALHAEKAVRPRAGILRAHQGFRHGQRPVAGHRHREHHRPPVRPSDCGAEPV